MTREMIINELNKRGYNAFAKNNIKNGVELEGICIPTDSNIAPIFYSEEIIENAENENRSLGEVVSFIIGCYEKNKSVKFDSKMLFNREFILNNIYIGLQKVSTEDIEKKLCGFEGIESYLYIRWKMDKEEFYSIKVSRAILGYANIAESEAWVQAEANTISETRLEKLSVVMQELMDGMMYDESFMEMAEEIPLFALSNTSKFRGASAILNKKVLADFAETYNVKKIVVFPSSINEMLLLPYTGDADLDTYSEMVAEVNSCAVDPTERLTDRAYIITI